VVADHQGDEHQGRVIAVSTIILLAPDHFEFCDNVKEGGRIGAGQPLLRNV
jgi:phosphatidylserine decarboxylase